MTSQARTLTPACVPRPIAPGRARSRLLLIRLLRALALCAIAVGAARAESVPLIGPDNFSADALAAALAPDVLQPDAPPASRSECPREAAVVIGEGQARQTLRTCPSVTAVVTHISRAALARLRHDHTAATLTGVYLEQPPALQLRLLRQAVPRARRVGVLYAHWSEPQLGELRAEATRLGLSLLEARVEAELHPVRALHDLLADIDAALLLADPDILNPETIKPLLLGSARHGVPMIGGLSEQHVRAGIAAGAFATEEAIAARAAALHDALSQGNDTPAPVYAADYRIHTNEHVGRILDVRTVTRMEPP